jgi:hypothetical protein
MLWFDNATTPRSAMVAVLEFLDAEAARHERSAKSSKLQRDKGENMARCNAIKNAANILRDCNVMRTPDKPPTEHEALTFAFNAIGRDIASDNLPRKRVVRDVI